MCLLISASWLQEGCKEVYQYDKITRGLSEITEEGKKGKNVAGVETQYYIQANKIYQLS